MNRLLRVGLVGVFGSVVAVSLGACGSSGSSDPKAKAVPASHALVEARPYASYVPAQYDPSKAAPLVVLLHGYSASGAVQDAYFGLRAAADAKTFLYAYPDGTVDSSAKRYWNATDACCNFDKTPVDDVAYVGAILDDMAYRYNVDPKRVYVVGHSNGAFMAHRLACELAPRVAAIVSLAGAQWSDASKCQPSEPVSVLQVHGQKDDTIQYAGGTIGAATYPSAHDTVATWAAKDGCSGTLAPTGRTLDLASDLPGAETSEETYGGCPAGIDVTLWTMADGPHIPALTAAWAPAIYDFLAAHPKR